MHAIDPDEEDDLVESGVIRFGESDRMRFWLPDGLTPQDVLGREWIGPILADSVDDKADEADEEVPF